MNKLSYWNYWRDRHGEISREFIEGVIAGVTAYARWKQGIQIVGILEHPLEEEIKEIKEALGWKEGGGE